MFLLYGKKGAGKTTCAGTLPKPILFYMFDPQGERVFQETALKGEIIVVDLSKNDDFETEAETFQFAKFRKHYRNLVQSGEGAKLAGVCIDSLTTWVDAAKRWTSRSKGREQGVLSQPDYGFVYGEITNAVRALQSLPAHFCLTAHIELTHDEMLGTHITALATHPGLRNLLPPLFSEYYVVRARKTKEGKYEHYLQVRADERYQATTRLGRKGKFNAEMTPDLRELLKLGGINFKDKPSVVGGG